MNGINDFYNSPPPIPPLEKGGKGGFDNYIFGASIILLCHSRLSGILFQERFWTSQNDRLFHVFLKPLISPEHRASPE
jgi:hypothetical protein